MFIYKNFKSGIIIYKKYYSLKDGNMKNIGNTSYWLGMVIIVVTHIYMLIAGLLESQIAAHSIMNLVAAGLIGYGWMKRS